jgi:hypothetical protein
MDPQTGPNQKAEVRLKKKRLSHDTNATLKTSPTKHINNSTSVGGYTTKNTIASPLQFHKGKIQQVHHVNKNKTELVMSSNHNQASISNIKGPTKKGNCDDIKTNMNMGELQSNEDYGLDMHISPGDGHGSTDAAQASSMNLE